MSELKQTDLSKRLRAKATQPFGPEDFVLLAQAADEIDRYYTGMLNWKATAEAQSTQPEATKPAQDLSGDTRAGKIVDYIYDRCGFVHRDMLVADVASMLAALASPADALVAGDSETVKDAERLDWEIVSKAANEANTKLGAWMPMQWVQAFVQLTMLYANHRERRMAEQFYLQDSRSYVGNDMLFWAKDGKGYTTDMRNAEVYTKAEAVAQYQSRETDIPWPKEYIDARTRPAVDMQYVSRDEALRGTGIVLVKQRKIPAMKFNCTGCGRFLKDADRYSMDCPNCGADNRP